MWFKMWAVNTVMNAQVSSKARNILAKSASLELLYSMELWGLDLLGSERKVCLFYT
jgi:hypothetical protein